MPSKLPGLTPEQHRQAADLIHQVDSTLHQLARLLSPAVGLAYVDRVSRIQRSLYHDLMGRLADAHATGGGDPSANPYSRTIC